jgi:membrane protein DedA with SNARE-associated domain
MHELLQQLLAWRHHLLVGYHHLIDWYLQSLDKGGYWLVALLMTIESSIVPLPSELVIPPAAHLAYTQGKMSVAGVIIAGALGSWFGATLMYWAARLAGRPLVMRYGRIVFIPPEKVAAAERWADRYGPFGIFFSRLLPVVRHLIGIPAGIVRMDFRLYSLYTLAGSAVWCSVLAWIGIKAGQDEALMHGDLHRVTLWAGGAFAVLGTMYYLFVHRQMKAAPRK